MEFKKMIFTTCLIYIFSMSFEYFGEVANAKEATKKVKSAKVKRKLTFTKAKPSPNAKAIDQLQKNQARRGEKIASFKSSHHIGEGEDGLLAIRNYTKLNAKAKSEVDTLVKSENMDRLQLYKLLAQDNKFNAQEELLLRKNMFQAILDVEPIGTYYYINKSWQQK